MTRWTADDLPEQTGRTFVVTGATSGIGRSTAVALAGAGATVVLAVRNLEKGEAVAAAITADHPEARVDVRRLDLADLASVRSFAAGWNEPLDVLINNAGVMSVRRATTADGYESQFGTNHLGHFALTNLLLPAIVDRVVTVSSNAHQRATLDLADPNWERRRYRPLDAYGQSKLANLLFTLELQRRLGGDGRRSVAAHPGWARSDLGTAGTGVAGRAVSAGLGRVFGQSADRGALPSLFAAVAELPGDSFVGPDGPRGFTGNPVLVGRSALASDPELAAQLWDLSEQLTGVRFGES